MGCWNGTCALSNLPIFYKDPVRVVLLRQQLHAVAAESFCTPDHLWEPLGVPLRGLYDDYGAVTKADTSGLGALFLKEDLQPYVQIVSDEFKGFVVDREALFAGDWESFFEHVERGRMHTKKCFRFSESSPTTAIISQALIHEDIYQAMTRFTWTQWTPDMETIDRRRLCEEAREYLLSLVDDVQQDRIDPDGAFHRDAVRRHVTIRESPSIFRQAMFGRPQETGLNATYDFQLRQRCAAASDIKKDFLDDKLVLDFMNDLVDFRLVHEVMNTGRRFWSPQSGAGSQDDRCAAQTLLADATRLKAVSIVMKREE